MQEQDNALRHHIERRRQQKIIIAYSSKIVTIIIQRGEETFTYLLMQPLPAVFLFQILIMLWMSLMVLGAYVLASEADLASQPDLNWQLSLVEDEMQSGDNERMKRSFEEVQDMGIAEAADSNDHPYSKRFINIFKSRPPKSEGYKRGPGFRSWGGKRSGTQSLIEDEFTMPSYQYIKRKIISGTKRRPFQSWGGKRSFKLPQFLTRQDMKKLMDNKRKFNSWGGKRGEDDEAEEQDERRSSDSSFQAWPGKTTADLY